MLPVPRMMEMPAPPHAVDFALEIPGRKVRVRVEAWEDERAPFEPAPAWERDRVREDDLRRLGMRLLQDGAAAEIVVALAVDEVFRMAATKEEKEAVRALFSCAEVQCSAGEARGEYRVAEMGQWQFLERFSNRVFRCLEGARFRMRMEDWVWEVGEPVVRRMVVQFEGQQ